MKLSSFVRALVPRVDSTGRCLRVRVETRIEARDDDYEQHEDGEHLVKKALHDAGAPNTQRARLSGIKMESDQLGCGVRRTICQMLTRR